MTVREVASYLNCHYMTVYKLVRSEDLPAFRLGSDWRFRRSDLEKWIAEKQVRPAGSGPKARKQKSAAEKLAPRKGRSTEMNDADEQPDRGPAERPGTARSGRAGLASAPLEMVIRAQSRLDVN